MEPVQCSNVKLTPAESFDSNHSSTPSFANREVSDANNQSNNCSITTPQTSPATTPIVESVTTRRRAKTNTHEENLQILAAIERGDLEELERFHRAGMTITSTIRYDSFYFFNPFVHAAENNNKELFLFLLKKVETPDTEHTFDTPISFLIRNDQPEFLEILEEHNILSAAYDANTADCSLRIPMINIAINHDSPKVIEWLLGKKIDLTIKSRHPDNFNFPKWESNNAFDLAIKKGDLTLLHKLMINFAKTNDNTIPLNKAQWLTGIMDLSNIQDLKSFIHNLEKFQNFSEIVNFLVEKANLIEKANEKKKIVFLDLLNREYGPRIFESLNIWQQPKERVFQFLEIVSALNNSKTGIGHLQTLIKDKVPDPKKITWLLEKSFQGLQNEPAFLAQSEKYCDVLSLIRACINLGATANAEYMLAYAIGEGDIALFHKSLNSVTESVRRKGSPKNLKSLFRNVTGLVKSRSKKAEMHSAEEMPSTSKQKKYFEKLFTDLCCHAVIFKFSENTLKMILLLIDMGANPYCLLESLIQSKFHTKTISDTDLVLIEKLIQRINKSAHSEHKANFSSILMNILRYNLPTELAKLFIRYGTDVTSSVEGLDGMSIKQIVIDAKACCKSDDDPKSAYWQDILTCMEESAKLCQTAVQHLTPTGQEN